MFGIIIDKSCRISFDEIRDIAKNSGKRPLLIALSDRERIIIKRLSRSYSIPYANLSGFSDFARLSKRLSFTLAESAVGAIYSLICYTPCYLSIKSEENRALLSLLFSSFGGIGVLPYLEGKKKYKPELSKSELEKILCDFDIKRLPRRTQAPRAYPYRFPDRSHG